MRKWLGIAVVAVSWSLQPAAGQVPPALRGGYPRAFFFRAAEGFAANRRIPYARWEATFSRLMGIEGKVLDEEVPGRSVRNVEFFTRFKRAHPDQLVLLHYNGNARDPRYQRGGFFAGHWIYYNGAKVLGDVPASDGVTEVRVDRPELFRVNIGRYRSDNDDVGLCELDANGRPDWHRAEQTQLVSVDAGRRVIRLRRGCYGTRPRAFRAGKGCAAAHVTEGPWGRKSHLMWYYNYSTRCPRDAEGLTCGQVHAADLARRFASGGELADFDGVEFDVLHHQRGRPKRSRGMDCDADGRADNGWLDGVNTYGLGVLEFARALRRLLPEKLLLADGHGPSHQRAVGLFNGIESEGFPALRDVKIRDFSGGLNRHFFWARSGRPPAFSYVNHKFTEPAGRPGTVRRPETPWSTHRLVFAAAVFTDSAICYSFAPPKEPGELLGVWDELWMGAAKRPGWLGKPLGPAVRLAQARPDLLAGKGLTPRANAPFGWQGGNVRLQWSKGALVARAAQIGQRELRFRLTTVPCNGPDLFVSVTLRGEPMDGCPRQMPRLATVGIPPARHMTWVGTEDFTSTFYFPDVRSKSVDLEFVVEGPEPVTLSRLTAHAHPDAIYREFENGLVLANPSPRPYAFDLARLFPAKRFRRIRASSRQDTATNDGSPVGKTVRLAPKDALFLVRDGR